MKSLTALTAIPLLFATTSIHAATVFVDFGSGPDTSGTLNGNYWNVWNPGNNLDLIDINGTTDTGWNLDSTTAAVVNNRTTLDYVFSYATTGAPSPFNHDNIASDALNLTPAQGVRNVRLTTLDLTKTYNFQIYGAREAAQTRITNYVVVGATSGSGTLTTTGTDIGSGGADYNNNTILTINGIKPDALGQILIEYSVNTGDFGYLNAFTVTEIPEPRAALLGGLGMLMLLRRRRRA
jgi:hypothetical protein